MVNKRVAEELFVLISLLLFQSTTGPSLWPTKTIVIPVGNKYILKKGNDEKDGSTVPYGLAFSLSHAVSVKVYTI